MTAVKEYKHQGETFQLDDSKGCYVAVTYKHLTGYVGVNLGKKASPKNPYACDEFFSACLSNPHTRRAYAHPVGRFLTWCDLAPTSGTTL